MKSFDADDKMVANDVSDLAVDISDLECRVRQAGHAIAHDAAFRGRVLDEVAKRDLLARFRRQIWLWVLALCSGLAGGSILQQSVHAQANSWTFDSAQDWQRRAAELAQDPEVGANWAFVEAFQRHRWERPKPGWPETQRSSW
ncbi:MAG: hypothetical protein AAF958_15060 [Planctomycetota bacterium]